MKERDWWMNDGKTELVVFCFIELILLFGTSTKPAEYRQDTENDA